MSVTFLRSNVPATSSGGIGLVLFYGAMIYLSTQLVDGPIRYMLGSVGGEALIYFRDAILILILGVVLITAISKGRINVVLLFFLVLLVLFSIVAVAYVRNIKQILFGLKIVLPFLAGLVCYRELFSDECRLTKYMGIFFFVALTGIYLNVFYRFPWTGLVYILADIQIEGGFDRFTSGFDRLQGFSRTNFEAATQVMLLVAYASVFFSSKWIRIILWIVAGGAIMLTTTKGIIVVYILLSLFYIAYLMMSKLYKLYRALLIVPMCAMVLIPVLLIEFDIDFSDPLEVSLYASFYDRVVNAWPPVFENVRENGSILIGLGVGGTGAGEYYFADDIKGAADNMFVYFYAWFGLTSVGLLGLLYWKSQKLNISSKRDDLCVYLWLVSILVYGVSSVIIESAFFAFFFGLCVAHISQAEKKHAENIRI